MKRQNYLKRLGAVLFSLLLCGAVMAQTTFYFVGANGTVFHNRASWNTAADGSGVYFDTGTATPGTGVLSDNSYRGVAGNIFRVPAGKTGTFNNGNFIQGATFAVEGTVDVPSGRNMTNWATSTIEVLDGGVFTSASTIGNANMTIIVRDGGLFEASQIFATLELVVEGTGIIRNNNTSQVAPGIIRGDGTLVMFRPNTMTAANWSASTFFGENGGTFVVADGGTFPLYDSYKNLEINSTAGRQVTGNTTVYGNLVINGPGSSGELRFADGTATVQGNVTLNNYATTVTLGNTTTRLLNLVFDGTEQTFGGSGTVLSGNVANGSVIRNVTINAGSIVRLTSDIYIRGTFTNNGTFDCNGFNLYDGTGNAVPCPVLNPTILVNPATSTGAPLDFGMIAANASKPLSVTVTGFALTGYLTVASDNPVFTVQPTITQAQVEAEGGYSLVITFNESESAAIDDYTGIISISGGGLAAPMAIYIAGTIEAADVTPPTVVSVSPNPATPEKLPLTGYITIIFDEAVELSTGTITLGSAFADILSITASAATVTISYAGLLQNTAYTLTIPSDAIVDLAGNQFAGDTFTWTTITPQPTIALADGSGAATQSARQGAAIEDIIFEITNTSVVAVQNQAALEALGLTVVIAPDLSSVTISGTVDIAADIRVQDYQIQATPLSTANDPATPATASGSILVRDINSKNVAYVTTAAAMNASDDHIRWELDVHYDVTSVDMATVVAYGATPNESQVELSNLDLIVFQESPDGANTNAVAGSYVGRVPVLNMKPHYYNSGRWSLGTGVNGSSDRTVTINSVFIDHPIFNGLDVSGGTLTYATGGSGNIIQGASGVTVGDLIASIPAGVSIHEIPVGTTLPAGNLGGRTTAERYLLVSLSNANRATVNANGLILFKNACDYLMGLTTPVTPPPAEPLASFTMKWSDAEITHPTADADGLIYIATLYTDNFECMEIYFTLNTGYEDCTVWLDGNQLFAATPDQQQPPVLSDYVCFPGTVSAGWTSLVEVFRPDGGLGRSAGELIATYSLEVGGVTTNLNSTDKENRKLQDCYTVTGVKVNCESATGIVIKRYTDGSTSKELK